MTKTPTFVITLDHRRDRQESATATLNHAGVNFNFIVSNQVEDMKRYEATKKITQIEVAIWGSHVKALQAFLETDSQWGLIFEDDFLLTEEGFNLLRNQNDVDFILSNLGDCYSILQIGFLENSQKSGYASLAAKMFRLVFRFNRFDLRSYVNHLRYAGFKEQRRMKKILEKSGLKRMTLLYGHRLGTHAYFVNREAASTIIDFFESRSTQRNFVVIDQFILRLTVKFTKKPVLRAARLSRSLVVQSGSPSDNTNATPVENFDRDYEDN